MINRITAYLYAAAMTLLLFGVWLSLHPEEPKTVQTFERSLAGQLFTQRESAMEVFRAAGCTDKSLADLTVKWARVRRLPVRVIAAQVVVESNCNPLAVSHDGSIGLMQVRVHVWRREFGLVRGGMFNADRSLEVGTEILRRHVVRLGLRRGIERYNGKGKRAKRYARRVLRLACQGA